MQLWLYFDERVRNLFDLSFYGILTCYGARILVEFWLSGDSSVNDGTVQLRGYELRKSDKAERGRDQKAEEGRTGRQNRNFGGVEFFVDLAQGFRASRGGEALEKGWIAGNNRCANKTQHHKSDRAGDWAG